MLFTSAYIPHALYSAAITSISIHLVSTRKSADSDRAHINAQISILESIKEQLQSNKPISNDELERLKRLARTPEKTVETTEEESIGWKEVFLGRKKAEDAPEMSKWDKKDMEKGATCHLDTTS